MKRTLLAVLALGMMVAVHAEQPDQVLMTIDGKPIMASEFMYIYEKNNQEAASDPKSMDEYLDLFTRFKLKVAEAEAERLDTAKSFNEELAGYRAQAVEKYLRDEQAIDSLIRLSYYRMAHLRRAAHIAVRCGEDAGDSLRQAAEARIQDLRRRAVSGKEDFYALAEKYSEDPNKDANGSELGWIIPFRYIYSFEDAVYSAPVGGISEVFHSPYGLHIALVEEEIETEEVHAAHIMKMTPKGDENKEVEAKRAIDSLYQVVMKGADFDETALRNSDDKGSAVRGGDLGWFTRGVMIPPFEKTAFALQPGETSEPLHSDYGWHIIRVYDRRKTEPLDSMYTAIRRKVERDDRMDEAHKSFVRKTRQEYALPQSMSDEEVMAYADAHLEEKYPELHNLVREYHDGILLFDISVDRVWDRASKDTAGLIRYFEEHRDAYKWDEPRFKGFVIYARDKKTAKRAETIANTVPADSVAKTIRERMNNDSVTIVRVERGLWKKGQNPAVDKFGLRSKVKDYQPDKEFPVVVAVGKKIANPESYTDERGKVVTDYQDQLEQAWVEELRKKHTVVLNEEVWQQLKAGR